MANLPKYTLASIFEVIRFSFKQCLLEEYYWRHVRKNDLVAFIKKLLFFANLTQTLKTQQ